MFYAALLVSRQDLFSPEWLSEMFGSTMPGGNQGLTLNRELVDSRDGHTTLPPHTLAPASFGLSAAAWLRLSSGSARLL